MMPCALEATTMLPNLMFAMLGFSLALATSLLLPSCPSPWNWHVFSVLVDVGNPRFLCGFIDAHH